MERLSATIALLAWLFLAVPSTHAVNGGKVVRHNVPVDTLRRAVPPKEMPSMRQRIMSSASPVTITQQGRRMCVYSHNSQLLPIYRADGTFYQAVRLAKGTTWINGLPKGKYIINGKEYSIN